MITSFLLLALATGPTGASTETWICEHMRSARSAPHDPPRNDLTISRRSADGADQWFVIWPEKEPILADHFDASYGSVGSSDALKWKDEAGKERKAFISYSDLKMNDGTKAAWLGLDKPSLWQPPGYVCQSQLSSTVD